MKNMIVGLAACGLFAASAANYTLTNTTVEWPSSNEAETARLDQRAAVPVL